MPHPLPLSSEILYFPSLFFYHHPRVCRVHLQCWVKPKRWKISIFLPKICIFSTLQSDGLCLRFSQGAL